MGIQFFSVKVYKSISNSKLYARIKFSFQPEEFHTHKDYELIDLNCELDFYTDIENISIMLQ